MVSPSALVSSPDEETCDTAPIGDACKDIRLDPSVTPLAFPDGLLTEATTLAALDVAEASPRAKGLFSADIVDRLPTDPVTLGIGLLTDAEAD